MSSVCLFSHENKQVVYLLCLGIQKQPAASSDEKISPTKLRSAPLKTHSMQHIEEHVHCSKPAGFIIQAAVFQAKKKQKKQNDPINKQANSI